MYSFFTPLNGLRRSRHTMSSTSFGQSGDKLCSSKSSVSSSAAERIGTSAAQTCVAESICQSKCLQLIWKLKVASPDCSPELTTTETASRSKMILATGHLSRSVVPINWVRFGRVKVSRLNTVMSNRSRRGALIWAIRLSK